MFVDTFYNFKLNFFLFLISLKSFLYGMRVFVAHTDSQKKDLFGVRHKVYIEEGYIKEDDYPDNSFTDKYDVFSVGFLLYCKKELIGSARLVLDSKNGFPLESYANVALDNIDRKEIGEISRLVVLKKYRGKKMNFLASTSLLVSIYKFALKNKISYFIFTISEKLAASMEKNFQIKLKVLDEMSLTEDHKKARAEISGYYSKVKDSHPYLISIKDFR